MKIKRLFALSAVLTLCSCVQDYFRLNDGKDETTGNVSFEMSAMTRAQIENSQVQIFQGTGPTLGRYVYRVPSFTKSGNTLYMEVRAGKWNMVLVTADQYNFDLQQLSQPNIAPGVTMYNTKMWEAVPVNGVLPSLLPEIMTGHIDDQTVSANTDNHGDVTLIRNVARVRVRVKEAKGFSVFGKPHTVTIGNVPTTLSWAGTLLPSKDNPATGIMSANFAMGQDPVNPDNQISYGSEGLEFIIPAHKGVDFDAANPTDITTKKLTISVDMQYTPGGRYQKTVEVPVVPIMNKTLDLSLIVSAQLSVEASILDWVEEDVDVDLSTQTSIEVSKTAVDIVGDTSSTVFVNASDDYTVTQDPWIRITRLPGGYIEISTDASSYTAPRSGYVSITANNLTKKILVNQRAGTGTISLSPDSFWVTQIPANQIKTIFVDVSPDNARWGLVGTYPSKVHMHSYFGDGDGGITFSRTPGPVWAGQGNDYSMFGNETITIRNLSSLETATITAQNLWLEAPEKINVNSGSANTTTYNDETIALGGSGTYYVKQVLYNGVGTGWLQEASVYDGRLKLVATTPPDEQVRWCTLVLAHTTDPTLIAEVRVEQDKYFDIIDPYSYLTGHFTWTPNAADGDIAVMIYDDNGKSLIHTTPSSAGGTFLGCYGWGNRTYNSSTYNALRSFRGQPVAKWGGDPGSGSGIITAGESFVVYVNSFDDYTVFPEDELTRYIHIYVYAWYYKRDTKAQSHLSLAYWDGGQIVETISHNTRKSYVYSNPTGTNLNPDPAPRQVYPSIPSSSTRADATYSITNVLNVSNNATTGYAKIVRIRYDRFTHKTMAVWYSSADNANWPTSYSPLMPQ